MALKLRNQWLSLSGVVALKFRTSGSERAGIIILAMDDDRENPEYKLLKRRFEDNKRHLKLCHKRLHKYMKMRDELVADENA